MYRVLSVSVALTRGLMAMFRTTDEKETLIRVRMLVACIVLYGVYTFVRKKNRLFMKGESITLH